MKGKDNIFHARKGMTCLLALVMMLIGVLGTPKTVEAALAACPVKHTADEAIGWVKSLNGTAYDYDKAYGAQCVDLIAGYYNYLGTATPGGNGADYASNAIPSNWSRIKGGVPQKGDILVYSGNTSNPYGHVAIYESKNGKNDVIWHGRLNGVGKVQVTDKVAYNQLSNPYWGLIRPKFAEGSSQSVTYKSSYPLVDGGTYKIVSVLSGRTIEVANGVKTNGKQLNLWPYSGESHMQWKAVKQSDGYSFINVGTGKAMDICGASTQGHVAVTQYDYVGNTAQRYKLVDKGNGKYGMIAICSNLAVDVCGSNKDNGAKLDQHEFHGGDNQLWKFERVDTPATYNVVYNANGGSGAPGKQTKTENVNLVLSSQVPTRSGYAFKAWNTKSDGSGTSYAPGATYKSNANVTLYAQWTPNKVTIQYNKNGGTVDRSNGAPSWDIDTGKPVHTVEYDTVDKGGPVNFSTFNLVRTGYHKKDGAEWNTKADGSGTAYNQKVEYKASQYADLSNGNKTITLYAQWTPNTLQIQYNANGGRVDTSSGAPKADMTTLVQKKNYTSEAFDPYNFSSFSLVRDGYTPKPGAQWNTKADGTGVSFDQDVKYEVSRYADLSNGNKTITLYAQWVAETPKIYSINYDADGGTGAPKAQSKKYGESVYLSSIVPTRKGYIFRWWSTKKDGDGKIYYPGALYNKDESVTLYARWESDKDYEFSLDKVKISKISKQKYTGSAIEPTFKVTLGKKTLVKDTDYKVTFSGNAETGTAKALIRGIGDYIGEREVTFTIVGTSISSAKVSGIEPRVYNAKDQKQSCELTYKGNVLREGKDYTVLYSKNQDAGTATMTFKGMGGYSGTLKKTFKIQPYNMAEDDQAKISGVPANLKVVYEKGGCRPTLELAFGSMRLEQNKDYTLSYSNYKAVGSVDSKKAPCITVKGKGNFKGSFKIFYEIMAADLPAKDSVVTCTLDLDVVADESMQEFVAETAQETAAETTEEAAQETAAETTEETTQEAAAETTEETAQEAAVETTGEAVAENAEGSVTEPNDEMIAAE